MPIKKSSKTENDNLLKNGTNLDILKSIERAYLKANDNPSAAQRYSNDALDWYRKWVPKNYSSARKSQLFMDRSLWSKTIKFGVPCFFDYDALHKDTLPVWDAFPLTIFFDTYRSKEGHIILLGLNLHYLPPKLRMIAFQALLKTRTEKRYRKQTKMDFDWTVLKGLAQHKYFKHCVKAYRIDHVQSVFVQIPSTAWQMALFLPVARWQNSTSKTAWKM